MHAASAGVFLLQSKAGGGGMRSMTEGASRVGIADLRAGQLEAATEFVRVGDDELLHLAEGALVGEETCLQFLRICGRRHLHEFRVLRGIAASAPGLSPEGVVEAAFGVGVELEEGLEFEVAQAIAARGFATGAEAGEDEGPERDQEGEEGRPVTQEPERVAALSHRPQYLFGTGGCGTDVIEKHGSGIVEPWCSSDCSEKSVCQFPGIAGSGAATPTGSFPGSSRESRLRDSRGPLAIPH